MGEWVRPLVALAVVGLLGRTLTPAWRNRALALRVWGRIRPRHVLGCLGLLAVVGGVVVGLTLLVPVTGLGLGSLLFGFDGNAVFAPLEQVSVLTGAGTLAEPVPAPDAPPGSAAPAPSRLPLIVVGALFLGVLVALLPWLAYVEEKVFREGLEGASPGRELWVALRFGLLHMLMLVPLAAALGIAVAGFAYGRAYRRAYARAASVEQRGPFGLVVVGPAPRTRARDEAVLAATTWHATFNTLVVLLVLVVFVTGVA